jgi:hypothetical protein
MLKSLITLNRFRPLFVCLPDYLVSLPDFVNVTCLGVMMGDT